MTLILSWNESLHQTRHATEFDYVPHSMFAEKDCPCDATRSKMSAIRRAVRAG